MIYRINAFFRLARFISTSFVAAVLLAGAPISALATGGVTVAWIASIDTSVVGYNLYYGSASGGYTNTIPAGSAMSASVSGLAEGTTYYFAATAYDNTGVESPFSNEVSYAVPLNSTNNPPILNNPPTLNALGNLAINQNAGLQTVNLSGISSGAPNEIQTLSVTTASSNPALIPAPAIGYASANSTGTLTFAPASNASGTAIITVTVNDGQAQNNTVSRTFTVTVNAVIEPPTLDPISDFYLTKNAPAQTVALTGISPGASSVGSSTAKTLSSTSTVKQATKIKITAVSGNAKLLKKPTVRHTAGSSAATLTFKPAKNATGTTTITVTINNGAKINNITKKTFKVTVLATGTAMPATLQPAAPVNGQFTISIAGSSGLTYIVQASTDMVKWVPVQTNTAPFTYTDTHAGEFSQRFFRTVSAE